MDKCAPQSADIDFHDIMILWEYVHKHRQFHVSESPHLHTNRSMKLCFFEFPWCTFGHVNLDLRLAHVF